MRVLFLYRNEGMGFSIGKVFRPIEEEMKKYAVVDHFYIPNRGYHPWVLLKNIIATKAYLKGHHYDIIHITGTEHYLLPFIAKEAKVVMTVHDLNYMQDSSLWNPKGLMRYWIFVRTLKKAHLITCISYKTQDEIIRWLPSVKHMVKTIWNPVGCEFVPCTRPKDHERPRLLHIGTKPNKNLLRSIDAMKGLDWELRIVGHLSEAQKTKLIESKIKYSVTADLTDEQIHEEYTKCDIVNFPSTYEGFGMPIIEGQGVGRPIVTSNIPPMNEVGRDSVVYVNPYSIESIREGYEEAWRNYDEWVNKGFSNMLDFRLSTITTQYFQTYNRLIAQS